MFSKTQGPLLREGYFWQVMELIFKRLEEIKMTQTQLAAGMREQTQKLVKIGEETSTLLEKVAALEAALDNQENVSPEVEAAFTDLQTQAQKVDDEVPDADSLPGKVDPANPGPDLASVNPSAQTAQEAAAGAGPGSLPDLQKQQAADAQASGGTTTLESGQVQSDGSLPSNPDDVRAAQGQHDNPELTPEQAAALERQAGVNLAKAGQELPVGATEAARAGYNESLP